MKKLHLFFSTFLCYVFSQDAMANMGEKTDSLVHTSEGSLKSKILNLPKANKFFTGREKEIQEISLALMKAPILIIEGISGIGKSQLAKKYAHTSLHKYDLIWWFDSDQNMETQIDGLLQEIFQRKNQPYYRPLNSLSLLRKLNHELSIFQGNWLIIVDNLDDTSLLSEYIPKNNGSLVKHVIVTSKKMNKTLPSMKINKFQRQESIDFLSKNLEDSRKEDLNALAKLLEDLPSALLQAVSYIKMNPSINVNTYLQLFKENRSELWKSEQKLLEGTKTRQSLSDQYNKTIATATKINLDSLKTSSPLAYKILTFCSLIDHQHIPPSALERWASNKLGVTKIEFHEALSLLLNNFLLEKETLPNAHQASDLLTQHELFQLIARDTLSEENKREMLNEASDFILQELTQSPSTLFEQFKGKEYFSNHLEKICNLADELRCKDPKIIELKIALLYFIHFIRRDFEKSSKLINELKSLVENNNALSPLAQLWFYCTVVNDQMFENLSKVEENLKNGLKYIENIKDDETKRSYLLHLNVDYAESLSNFGRLKDAVSLCDRLGEIVEKTENKFQKTAFFGTSALIHLRYGQYAQCLRDIDSSFKLMSEQPDGSNYDLHLLLIKAHCLLYQEMPEESYKIIEKIYPRLLELFTSPENAVIVNAKLVKGGCLAAFRKLQEASQLIQGTLHIYQTTTGFENDILKGMGHRLLGEVLETGGDLEKAYIEYAKAEALYDKILKEKTFDDLSLLYACLSILGAKQGDEGMVAKYLSLHIDNFGLAHPRTFEIKRFLDDRGLPLP